MTRRALYRASVLLLLLFLEAASTTEFAQYRSNAGLLRDALPADCALRVQLDEMHDVYPAVDPSYNLTRLILHDHPEGVFPAHRALVVCGPGAQDLVAQELCARVIASLCDVSLGGDALVAFVLVPNPVGRQRVLAQYASIVADPTFDYAGGRYSGPLSDEQLCDDSSGRAVDIDRNFPAGADDQRSPLSLAMLGRSYLPFSEVEARILAYTVATVRPTSLLKLEASDYYGVALPLDRGHERMIDSLETQRLATKQALSALMPPAARTYDCGADARRSGPKAGTLTDWAFDAAGVARVASLSIYDYGGAFRPSQCLFRRVPFLRPQLDATLDSWAPVVVAAISAVESL